jgi:hypothetical protein
MEATLLHQGSDLGQYPDIDEYGEWIDQQDPLTGDIVKIWVPYDDPQTPENEDPLFIGTIDCLARGIVDGGIRVAGTTEWFGSEYRNIDFVKLWTPAHVRINKRDRVTNIKDAGGRIRWADEEFEPRDPNIPVDETDPDTYNLTKRATVFNVNGVTPLFDASNNLREWYVMLEKAEV